MKLLLDDDLVEAVVFLLATGPHPGVPPLQVRRYHAGRERCYQVLDPEERARAFARLHLEWFIEWGAEKLLANAVRRFAPLQAALEVLAFRKARTRREEGAELFTNLESGRRGVVALQPERWTDADALGRFLHHELAHLADMVDPAFGYLPDLAVAGSSAAHQRLVRERYRLLWEVSLDGRLTRRGLATVAGESQRRQEFERGFAFLPEARRAELFAALWTGTLARHQDLLEIAADPRGLRERHTPVPGAPCPLCGFPAFQWVSPATLKPAAVDRIRREFPGWNDAEALCARCAEVYETVTGLELPATVVG